MVSVHAPSYIPPLTFEPFALSETHKALTASISIPSVPSQVPSAYSPTRIRGPRRRRKFSHPISQQAPARPSDGEPLVAAQRPVLRKSTTIHNTRDPLLSNLSSAASNGVLTRSTSHIASKSDAPGHLDHNAEDFSLLHRSGQSAGEQRSAGELQKHVSSRSQGNATGTNAHTAVAEDVENPSTLKLDDPRIVMGSFPHISSYAKTTILQDDPIAASAAPTTEHGSDDDDVRAHRTSTASSRPSTGVRENTIDQLESLAESLRTTHPMLVPDSIRPRVHGPRHGPRPRTPQSGSSTPRSGPTTPRVQTAFNTQRRPSDDISRNVYSAVQNFGAIEDSIPSRAAVSQDGVSVGELASWSTAAKGKWKTAWVEVDQDEEQELSPSLDATYDTLLSSGSTPDIEPYYTYDPHNAPEFLVGTSTSLTAQATPGSHSRHPPRVRTVRKPPSRRNRPVALVLALGSQLDSHCREDSHESSEPSNHTVPTPSTTRSLHQPKPFDLGGLELLIGPPPKPKSKPKPAPEPHPPLPSSIRSQENPALAPLQRQLRSDGQLRRVASWSAANPTPRTKHRRGAFSLLKRWFRRWTR